MKQNSHIPQQVTGFVNLWIWTLGSGLALPLSRDQGMITVTVPNIDRHEIVVFENYH